MVKKRKVQSFLLAIIFLLMTSLLYLGLSIINQPQMTAQMFERSNAVDSMILFDYLDEDQVVNSIEWWEQQEGIEGTLVYDTLMTNVDYERDGKMETELALITAYNEESPYDLLYKSEHERVSPPQAYEVYVNYNFAKSRNLQIDDSIIYYLNGEKIEFVIKELVVDPQFSNPFLSPNRFFVSEDFFQGLDQETTGKLMGIKYKQGLDELRLFDAYKEASMTNGMFIDSETIRDSYEIITVIIASILLGVAILIFAIVVFVIRSLIKNIVIQQYKQIGVKKVIGYTNDQIRNSFILMYTSLSFIASTIGAFIGVLINEKVSQTLNYDLQIEAQADMDGRMILALALVVGATMVFTYLATRQTNQVKPVQAIKYGMSESKMKNTSFNISKKNKLPINFLYAIKNILSNKRKTVTTLLLLVLLIYAAFIIQNAGSSLSNDEDLIENIFSLTIGDAVVSNTNEKDINQFMDTLEAVDGVEKAVFYRYEIANTSPSLEGNEDVSLGAMLIYGDLPQDTLKTYDGRQPVNENEIAISYLVSQATGKTVGDYMLIEKNGLSQNYLISGLYNTVNFAGYAYFKVMEEASDTLSPDSGMYWLYTKEAEPVIEDIEDSLYELIDYKVKLDRYDPQTKDVIETVAPFPIVIKSLLTIFMVISCVVILNATLMDINEATRSYGILKVIGFSNRSIAFVMIIKSLVLTIFAILLAFLLNMFTANLIMKSLLSMTPFSTLEFNISMDYTGCISLVLLFVSISVIATLLPARKIQAISPKILMSE